MTSGRMRSHDALDGVRIRQVDLPPPRPSVARAGASRERGSRSRSRRACGRDALPMKPDAPVTSARLTGTLARSPAVARRIRRSPHIGERKPRALGDVEQRAGAVGLVQDPEHRQLLDAGGRPADRAVQAALARAAARPSARGSGTSGRARGRRRSRAPRAASSSSCSRTDEVEVVGRGVVLGELALERAGQAADGEIEPGRVELPLVPTPRDEVEHASAVALADHVRARPGRRARRRAGFACRSAAPASPTHATTSPPTIALSRSSFRASQAIEPIVPGMNRRRYDRRRGELGQRGAELRQERDPGEVVVRERRMADVRREQHLVLAPRRAGSTRRTSATRARACCRSRPRTSRPRARRAGSARDRTPRSASSTTSGTGSSPARSACACRCGRSSSSVISARTGSL